MGVPHIPDGVFTTLFVLAAIGALACASLAGLIGYHLIRAILFYAGVL